MRASAAINVSTALFVQDILCVKVYVRCALWVRIWSYSCIKFVFINKFCWWHTSGFGRTTAALSRCRCRCDDITINFDRRNNNIDKENQ